jgi:hypothetical protein
VTPKIGSEDEELLREARNHLVPDGVVAADPVQKNDRGTGALGPAAQFDR